MFEIQQANHCVWLWQREKRVSHVRLEQKKVLGEVTGSVKYTEGFCLYPQRNEMSSKRSK